MAGGVITPQILIFASGIYEEIGLTATIVLLLAGFVFSVWFIIGCYKLYEMAFPPKRPISFIDFIKKSQKYGWRVSEDNFDILDLIDALKDFAANGEIIVSGKEARPNDFDSLTINKPCTDIPKELWTKLSINWPGLFKRMDTRPLEFQNNNFLISAYIIGDGSSNRYKDLHIKSDNLPRWFKIAKKEFLGRRQSQELERKRRFQGLEEGISNDD